MPPIAPDHNSRPAAPQSYGGLPGAPSRRQKSNFFSARRKRKKQDLVAATGLIDGSGDALPVAGPLPNATPESKAASLATKPYNSTPADAVGMPPPAMVADYFPPGYDKPGVGGSYPQQPDGVSPTYVADHFPPPSGVPYNPPIVTDQPPTGSSTPTYVADHWGDSTGPAVPVYGADGTVVSNGRSAAPQAPAPKQPQVLYPDPTVDLGGGGVSGTASGPNSMPPLMRPDSPAPKSGRAWGTDLTPGQKDKGPLDSVMSPGFTADIKIKATSLQSIVSEASRAAAGQINPEGPPLKQGTQVMKIEGPLMFMPAESRTASGMYGSSGSVSGQPTSASPSDVMISPPQPPLDHGAGTVPGFSS